MSINNEIQLQHQHSVIYCIGLYSNSRIHAKIYLLWVTLADKKLIYYTTYSMVAASFLTTIPSDSQKTKYLSV